MVLAVLAIVWVVVIGSYLKEKTSVRTGDSVTAFKDQLSTLQRTQVGPDGRPLPASRSLNSAAASREARRRRRDVLFTLVGLALFTFLVAVFERSTGFILLNILFDLVAAGYVALLVNQQRVFREQRTKVRHLRPVATQAPAYRATAAAGGRTFR